jgi:hypothetical protein
MRVRAAIARDFILGVLIVLGADWAVSAIAGREFAAGILAATPFIVGLALWMSIRAPLTSIAAWAIPLTGVALFGWAVNTPVGTVAYGIAFALLAILTIWARATAWWIQLTSGPADGGSHDRPKHGT